MNTWFKRGLFLVLALLWMLLPIRGQAAPIMLQGAMACEVEDMIASLHNPCEEMVGPWRFVRGDYQGIPVIVSVTRVGVSNAAAATALGIEHFHPAAVINQGTCGGHDPALHTFDLVIGENSFDSSAWISHPQGESAAEPAKKFYAVKDDDTFHYDIKIAADAVLLATAKEQAKSYKKGRTLVGTISSSNSWNRRQDVILFLNREYGSLCEEMETHSVAQICQRYVVPFIGLRVLSNAELHGEMFDPAAGRASQEFALQVAKAYYLR